MSLDLQNLDVRTREYMLKEVDLDVKAGRLYVSPKRLNDIGRQRYEPLLREAIGNHDDVWLAGQLRDKGCMNSQEEKRKPKGGFTIAQVPITAPDTLAEGEFNRFYCRGLCARALDDGIAEVEVYRAKEVSQPRAESAAMIGKRLPARDLLNDLRQSQGVEPALGLPPGPNSGLSVRLP